MIQSTHIGLKLKKALDRCVGDKHLSVSNETDVVGHATRVHGGRFGGGSRRGTCQEFLETEWLRDWMCNNYWKLSALAKKILEFHMSNCQNLRCRQHHYK